jgi:hypothetical protein
LENLKGSEKSGDLNIDGRRTLIFTFTKQSTRMLTGFSWIRIRARGRILYTQQ